MAKRSRGRAAWRSPIFWFALAIPTILVLYAGLLYSILPASKGEQLSYTSFIRRLERRDVASPVLLNEDRRVLFKSGGKDYWSSLPTDPARERFLNAAVDQDLRVQVDQQSFKRIILPATQYLIPSLFIGCILILTFLLTRSDRGGNKGITTRKSKGESVTFADVAGNDEAVAEVREVRDYLLHPERLAEIGAQPPRGILLVGPPGTGKTLLARAIAGEAGVPFFTASGTQFVEMYQGVGAARVRELFREVRESAPAILFLDELDAAGRTRAAESTTGQEERDQTLNQLLVEMDGFDRFAGVVIIGATNRPDVLDPALLRRGRFDRQVVVDAPDRVGRLAILKIHSRGKRLDPSVALERLARQTPGLTGADLASVMNEAALLSARRGKPAITPAEVEEAVDRVIAGNERAQVLTPAEKRAVAYHESGHAVVAWALPHADPVTKISIVSRGQALGGRTWMAAEEERVLLTKTELESVIAVAMAGMAAEELVFGESTNGARDDLREATAMAREMVCELGMSESLGRLAWGQQVGSQFLGGDARKVDYSDAMAAEIDREVKRIADEAYSMAARVLQANRPTLDRVAAYLVEKETVRDPELSQMAADVVRLDSGSS
ncbi:MAG TPA: ATP-dependent zinc metalloprotease FtsH, partial [Acidimicrobiales bacterium]|nr:ATP-dependent zinc metalloprotease FtsH [Acidimicrobiales bacterium]